MPVVVVAVVVVVVVADVLIIVIAVLINVVVVVLTIIFWHFGGLKSDIQRLLYILHSLLRPTVSLRSPFGRIPRINLNRNVVCELELYLHFLPF